VKRPSPIVIAELVAMVAAALLLATVGAILTAIEGPAPDPLDDRERPSHR
jgi:hypothetical protein